MQLFQSNENCRPEWKLTNLTLNTALEDCIELTGLVMHWELKYSVITIINTSTSRMLDLLYLV
jgi:hypothetical protein